MNKITIDLDCFIDSATGRMIPDYDNMHYELEQEVEEEVEKYNKTIEPVNK